MKCEKCGMENPADWYAFPFGPECICMACLMAAGWVSNGRGRWVRHSSFTGKAPAESTGFITDDMLSGRFKWVVIPYGARGDAPDSIYDKGYAASLGEARREADKAIRELEATL